MKQHTLKPKLKEKGLVVCNCIAVFSGMKYIRQNAMYATEWLHGLI